MKLSHHLFVGGKEYRVIDRSVSLVLSGVGRAKFKVAAASRPKGLVVFSTGFQRHRMHDFFMGFICAAHQDGAAWVLECRELIDGLTQPAAISLRQCRVADVVRDIQTATLVRFSSADFGSQRPRFASHASGIHALRMIPKVFGVADFEFWQQTDGKIWLGEWQTAEEKYTTNRSIDPKFFSQAAGDSAVLPALPVLRPGMQVNGRRIAGVKLVKHETHIRWKS